MAERLLTAACGKVPHHRPVTPECPVECLLTVLSLNSFNPLTRAYDAPFDEPRTVADVMDLCARRELRKIRGRRPSPGLRDRGRPCPCRAEPRRPPGTAPGRANCRSARGAAKT